MYNDWFGLRKDAFSLAQDASFLFLTDQHREALSGLTFAILQRRGFVVLTGEIGAGKSTLVSRIVRFLPAAKLQYSWIVNPTMTPSEFLELTLLEFGLTDLPVNKGQQLFALRNLILRGEQEGRVTALIVDEAQKLSPEVLEEIRMLANLERTEQPCLQILLVGQPEFDDILSQKEKRMLKQRIAVRFNLQPLASAEVGEYIRHRWLVAGGTNFPFTPEAIGDVATASQRIPRMINSICDNALLRAFEDHSKLVLDSHVRVAAASLNLGELPARESPVQPEPSAFKTFLQPKSLRGRWISRHESA